MSVQIVAFPYKSAHFANGEDFVVGEGRVKEIRTGQGVSGFLMVYIKFEECAECPSERRFMVAPGGVLFECGEPIEVDPPEKKPELLVPKADGLRVIR